MEGKVDIEVIEPFNQLERYMVNVLKNEKHIPRSLFSQYTMFGYDDEEIFKIDLNLMVRLFNKTILEEGENPKPPETPTLSNIHLFSKYEPFVSDDGETGL